MLQTLYIITSFQFSPTKAILLTQNKSRSIHSINLEFLLLYVYRYSLTTNTRVAMSEDSVASDFIGNLRKLCD